MNLACLMPTYGRHPALLESSIAMFEAQDYSGGKKLFIFDDLGNITEQSGRDWFVVSTPIRSQSLPHKYDTMLRYLGTTQTPTTGMEWLEGGNPFDAVVVWDDDDIYHPKTLSAHAAALHRSGWSHPSKVRSLCGRHEDGTPQIEDSGGRFHGALAIRCDMLHTVGGWLGVMPTGHERRADFDQRMLSTLKFHEPAGDPLDFFPSPTYVYGWGRTNHCSGLMRTPEDETWYENHKPGFTGRIENLNPRLDAQAAKILQILS